MIRALMLGLSLLISATSVSAQCRQALALALDVSGSVDTQEYNFQIGGLIAALDHPEVVQALLAMPSAPVQLTVFEWSSPDYQRPLLDWTPIPDAASLTRIREHLARAKRLPSPPGTALGTAMQFGANLLAQRPECWKRTLDISGDGMRNMGPQPRDVRAALSGQSLTINALVIGADDQGVGDLRQVEISELSSYFRALVIIGPNAFVETALGFENYEAAMVRKLIREMEGLVLSSLQMRMQRP